MNIKNKKQLGELLKSIRVKKKLSKRAIYKDKTIYALQLESIEQGKANYTIDTLFVYLEKIGVSIDEIGGFLD